MRGDEVGGYGRFLDGVGVSLDRSDEGSEKGQAGRRGGRQADRGRSSVVRGPWFVVKGKVGGNKGKLLSFHYARYQGPRAKRLLITKEANLSVSLARPLPSVSQLHVPCSSFSFRLTAASRQGPPAIRHARNSIQNSAS